MGDGNKSFAKAYKTVKSLDTTIILYFFKVKDGDLIVIVNAHDRVEFYECILKYKYARYMRRSHKAWMQYIELLNFETDDEFERYLSANQRHHQGL